MTDSNKRGRNLRLKAMIGSNRPKDKRILNSKQ